MTGFRPQLTTSVPLAAFIEPIRKALRTASARNTTAPVDRESVSARESLICALTGLAACTSWAEYDARRSDLSPGQFDAWQNLSGASEVERAMLGCLQDVCGPRHLKRCFDLGFNKQGKALYHLPDSRIDITPVYVRAEYLPATRCTNGGQEEQPCQSLMFVSQGLRTSATPLDCEQRGLLRSLEDNLDWILETKEASPPSGEDNTVRLRACLTALASATSEEELDDLLFSFRNTSRGDFTPRELWQALRNIKEAHSCYQDALGSLRGLLS